MPTEQALPVTKSQQQVLSYMVRQNLQILKRKSSSKKCEVFVSPERVCSLKVEKENESRKCLENNAGDPN